MVDLLMRLWDGTVAFEVKKGPSNFVKMSLNGVMIV